MEAREFILTELALDGVDSELQSLFNYALGQVFSPSIVRKIEEKIRQNIKIKEVIKNDDIVAYQSGNTIFVNRPAFAEKTQEQKIQYLLHETFHLLQTSKHLFVLQNFKELNELSKELFEIVRRGLVKSYSVFLTGKEIKLPTGGYEELLPYFCNNKIDWSAVTPQTRVQFIKKMAQSKLFNLKSRFWAKRLYS